jgi:hypothetical protein
MVSDHSQQSTKRWLCVFAGVLAAMCFPVTGANRLLAQDPQLRFGSRVPADVEMIYERGLSWLAEHQTERGDWGGQASSRGRGSSGAAITGMGIMVFLASGEDPNFGKYSQNLRAAVRSIITAQDSVTGYLGNSMYHHGFGMLGLSEVYGVLDEDTLWAGTEVMRRRSIGEALELAVRCAVTAQKNNSWGGWRYSPSENNSDTSVAGAVLMGLFAARNAGVKVPDDCIDKAVDYFRKMTSSQGGVGYSGTRRGAGGSKNLQAIASLVYAIGRRKDLKESQAVFRQTVGNTEYSPNNYPFYFRYYMAQALFQGDFAAWDKWNTKTIRQLKPLQNDDGSFASSHGPAYGTSMSLLALALNYRFLPIYER